MSTIGVIALGKIGLPLAVQYASKGNQVLGFDINKEVVTKVNAGEEPFPGEEGLASALKSCVDSGLLRAYSSYADGISHCEVVVLVVPLVVGSDSKPDFQLLDFATADLAANLRPGTLVIYETTLPVGTTRNRWKPMLETGSGLKEGEGFDLVFSPERVFTGRIFSDLRRYPKLVGGFSIKGEQRAVEFYESVLDFDERPDLARRNGVWSMGTPEAAEMAKLVETTYRDVNIGLANQFAAFSEENGIDFYKVREACNSQPYSQIHAPGISVGGHCIPVYPRLYLWNDNGATIVEAARRQNSAMPSLCVERLEKKLGGLEGVTIEILGAAYRGGVKETAFSGVFDLVDLLERKKATVSVSDPMFSQAELEKIGLPVGRYGLAPEVLIVQTDHSEYSRLSADYYPQVHTILDGRNIVPEDKWPNVSILTVGRPAQESLNQVLEE